MSKFTNPEALSNALEPHIKAISAICDENGISYVLAVDTGQVTQTPIYHSTAHIHPRCATRVRVAARALCDDTRMELIRLCDLVLSPDVPVSIASVDKSMGDRQEGRAKWN